MTWTTVFLVLVVWCLVAVVVGFSLAFSPSLLTLDSHRRPHVVRLRRAETWAAAVGLQTQPRPSR